MQLTFLGASVPLTKTFIMNKGVLEKQAHPKITSCTSYIENVNSIEEFKTALEAHADQGHCLLKGNTNRPLVNESRASSTDPNAKTSWVCLDIDGIKGCSNVNDLLKPLGLADIDHIIQYSSSMGIVPDRGMSAHVFMFPDKDTIPELLKRWLTHLNLTTEILVKNLNLTRTHNALRWALDITTCQNDKLIYIAPPILGVGVKDSVPAGGRITLIKKKQRVFQLPDDIPDLPAIKNLTEKGLALIRDREGLPPRPKTTYKQSGTIEYIANPDQAQVTGIKEDGNFVHLNLNGGDSWAYWHHKTNPEFIFNFKNEPTYRTSELLPEYWKEIRPKEPDHVESASGTEYIVFRNFHTATYHNAIWTPATKKLEIARATGKDQLKDFMQSHGQPKPDIIPDWRVEFNPHSNLIVDQENRIINEFQPNIYMLMKGAKSARVPPIIRKTLWNLLGSDQEAYDHWLNWCACIMQYRIKTQAAWIVHGTTGTGKGTLVNQVLKPLFKYVEFRRTRELASQFNEFLEKCLILWIDEAEVGGKNGGQFVENDMKVYITEPDVSIRKMQTAGYLAKSYVNTMLSSNNGAQIVLRPEDRRFNVAPFQREKIVYKTGEYEAIADELEEMAQFLHAYPADKDVARIPLDNAAKRAMIYLNREGTDSVIDHLKAGDYQFFVDGKPTIVTESVSNSDQRIATSYIELVDSMKDRNYLLREEVMLLLTYLMNGLPTSPYKFTSYMKHHDLFFEPVIHNDKTVKGLKTSWK